MGMAPATREVSKQELLRLLLAKYRLKECAAMLKLSYATVRGYAAQPLFMEELKALSKEIWGDVEEELRIDANSIRKLKEELSMRALLKLGDLIDSQSEQISLKASTEMLDRHEETSKQTKVETNNHHTMDPMLLIHAAATAREVEDYDAKKRLDGNAGSVQ